MNLLSCETPEDYFNHGVAEEEKQNYKGAIAYYTSAIKLNPNFIDAYEKRADVMCILQDYNCAFEDIIKALAIFLKSSSNSSRSEIEKYISQFNLDNDKEANNTSAFTHTIIGISYLKKNEYQKAINEYNIAIDLNPNSAVAYSHRGVALKGVQDYNAALCDFDKAVELNPDYAITYVNRGLLKSEHYYKYVEAIEDYSMAIRLNPCIAEAYYNRGNAKDKLQDYIGAVEDFSMSIEIDPKFSNAYCNRGNIMKAFKNFTAAILDYSYAISYDPENAINYYNRGTTYLLLNDDVSGYSDLNIAGRLGIEKAYDILIQKIKINKTQSYKVIDESVQSIELSRINKYGFLPLNRYYDYYKYKTVLINEPGTLCNSLKCWESSCSQSESFDLINYDSPKYLRIIGNVDARDFRYLRDNVSGIGILNLCAVNITVYEGTDGTSDDQINKYYPANEIPEKAFSINQQEKLLQHIILPNSIISIGNSAFESCVQLDNVVIPNSVLSIGHSAFSGCRDLTKIIIGSGVSTIKSRVFSMCTKLINITIPRNVNVIGDSAFFLSGLCQVSIPKSVKSIGMNAFGNCKGLLEINVHSENPNYSSIDGVLFNKEKTILIKYPVKKGENIYMIPRSVKFLEESSFCEAQNLIKVVFPDSLVEIGNRTFYKCNELIGLIFPDKVTTIGIGAFSNCTKITNITFSKTITTIKEYAFNDCTSLTNIAIPNSVAIIGEKAFPECSKITICT